MPNTLTIDVLSPYLKKNIKYYEKYLEKFNKNQTFFSWNWAALLIPQLWLPYRKQWGLFISTLIFLSLALYINYLAILPAHTISPYLLFGISILTLVFLFYLALKSNQKVLEKALDSENNQNACSPWYIVLIACLIFTAPIQLFLYKVNIFVSKQQRIETLENLSNDNHNYETIIDLIKKTPNDEFTSKAVQELLCYDDEGLLIALSNKSISFSADHIKLAYRCKASLSVSYLVESGLTPQEIVIEDAIYQKDLTMVKALLDSQAKINKKNLAYALSEDEKNINRPLAEYLFAKTKNIPPPTYTNAVSDMLSNALVITTMTYPNLKWAERILEAGSNPNIVHNHDPLLYAFVERQSLEWINLVLKYKADPNFGGILERAIRTNNPKIVERILQSGAYIDSKTMETTERLYEGKFVTNRDIWSDEERESYVRITELLAIYREKGQFKE